MKPSLKPIVLCGIGALEITIVLLLFLFALGLLAAG